MKMTKINLTERSPFHSGYFCRVYECDTFPALGTLQVLITAEDSADGSPCLFVKTCAKGMFIQVKKAFQDSEKGEKARDKILESMTPQKAVQLLEAFQVSKTLTLLNESVVNKEAV